MAKKLEIVATVTFTEFRSPLALLEKYPEAVLLEVAGRAVIGRCEGCGVVLCEGDLFQVWAGEDETTYLCPDHLLSDLEESGT